VNGTEDLRDLKQMKINSIEANYWWRKTEPTGALLNNLLFAFIVVPIALVLKTFYTLSFVVFAFMVPYGLFVRHLAGIAVRRYLSSHPEALQDFEEDGIISF